MLENEVNDKTKELGRDRTTVAILESSITDSKYAITHLKEDLLIAGEAISRLQQAFAKKEADVTRIRAEVATAQLSMVDVQELISKKDAKLT
jgi:hypothetical protein